MQEIKTFEYPYEQMETISLTEEELINNIDKYNIVHISTGDIIEVGDKKFVFNDYQHPISYSDFTWDKNTLTINEDYYSDNKNKINKVLIDVIKHAGDYIHIDDTCLINNELIQAIANNPNIKKVKLGNSSDIYYLSENDFNILNNNHIEKIYTDGVEEALKDNFNDKIAYNFDRFLIGTYKYSELINQDEFSFYLPVSSDKLDNFKYIKKGSKIRFAMLDDKDLFNKINKINELGLDLEIVVADNEIEKHNSILLSDNYVVPPNVKVEINSTTIALSEYIKTQKLLYSFIEPAQNLSKFEQFLYVYDIVKHFKQYKESEDKSKSRNIYEILTNDEYMVCVGYADLLINLLNKLGIDAMHYSVGVDIGFENANINDEMINSDNHSEYAGHARAIVNLKDDKYGIDGIFISDPTWDNVLDNDSYTYALMTYDELSNDKNHTYIDKNITSLLFCKDIQMFYNLINEYINKYVDKYTSNESAQSRFFSELTDLFKNVDHKMFKYLKSKYDEYLENKSQDLFNETITEIGYYTVNKNNKPINLEQYKQALYVLYSNFYGLEGEELEKEVNRTIEFNKQRFKIAFPTSYRINPDDSKEIYSSLDNKWDEQEITKYR